MSMPTARRRLAVLAVSAALATSLGVTTGAPAGAAIIPGLCTYTSSQPTLRQGSSGTSVRQLQCELNYSMRYTKVTVDGSFGPRTNSAVRTFQRCAGIGVDGVVGPQTWAALNYWANSPNYLNC